MADTGVAPRRAGTQAIAQIGRIAIALAGNDGYARSMGVAQIPELIYCCFPWLRGADTGLMFSVHRSLISEVGNPYGLARLIDDSAVDAGRFEVPELAARPAMQ